MNIVFREFVNVKSSFAYLGILQSLGCHLHCVYMLSTQMALLRLSANTSYVGTQKDTIGLKFA